MKFAMKFPNKFPRLILAALVVFFAPILSQQNIFAQEKKAAPSHVHYTEPAQQTVSPTGALAPRLQKLGPAHVRVQRFRDRAFRRA